MRAWLEAAPGWARRNDRRSRGRAARRRYDTIKGADWLGDQDAIQARAWSVVGDGAPPEQRLTRRPFRAVHVPRGAQGGD